MVNNRQTSTITKLVYGLAGLSLLIVTAGFSPLANATEQKAAGDAAISNDTAKEILKELKNIRQVLEKIEKQGGTNARPSKARPTTAKVSAGGKQAMGNENAPITVVEFTDYQCPFCLRFTKNTFPQLKSKYVDTGKVRWVAMNLPLAFHKDAKKAAQAAHCAGDQGKFWEMRTELFENPKNLSEKDLPAYAEKLALDMSAFNSCMQSTRHMDAIEKEAKDANAVKLTGTPSFIIGKTTSDIIFGKVVVGAQPLNKFEAIIDKELEHAPVKDKAKQKH
jgi:protein-disulfide isomerase